MILASNGFDPVAGAGCQVVSEHDRADRLDASAPVTVYMGSSYCDRAPGTCRVGSNPLNEILSDIKLACTREAELGEPARAFGDGGIGPYDFAGDRYVRLRTLRKRLHRLNGPIAA